MNLPRVCFVCSAARSGSTLLDLVIGNHQNAASLGEFSFLGKALALKQDCTCGENIHNCAQWQRVFDLVQSERSTDLRKNPYALSQWDTLASTVVDKEQQTQWYKIARKFRSLICDLKYHDYLKLGHQLNLPPPLSQGVKNTTELLTLVTQAWGKDLAVDSSKNVHKAIAVAQSGTVEAKIIYLVRDGRGVYHSRRSSGFSRRESASGWLNYNRRASVLLPRHIAPSNLMQVHYEDLVTKQDSTIRSIYEFLELDIDEKVANVDPAESHMVNGNDMRFKGKQKLVADERWGSELSAEELRWFNKNAGAMNRSLGYS